MIEDFDESRAPAMFRIWVALGLPRNAFSAYLERNGTRATCLALMCEFNHHTHSGEPLPRRAELELS